MTNKTKWVIRDRQKFSELIQEVKNLIDGLVDITKPLSTATRQEGMLRYKIQQIKDPDTLSLVSEVCQCDYPDVSDAATIKLDALTIENDHRETIETWASSVDDDPNWDGDDDDLESLTITELKALLRKKTETEDEDIEIVKVEKLIEPISRSKERADDKRKKTEAEDEDIEMVMAEWVTEPTSRSRERADGKTMEELALENSTLKNMSDTLSRRLQMFGMGGQGKMSAQGESRVLTDIDRLSAGTIFTSHDDISGAPFRSDSQGNGKKSRGKLPPRNIFKKSTLSSAAEI